MAAFVVISADSLAGCVVHSRRAAAEGAGLGGARQQKLRGEPQFDLAHVVGLAVHIGDLRSAEARDLVLGQRALGEHDLCAFGGFFGRDRGHLSPL